MLFNVAQRVGAATRIRGLRKTVGKHDVKRRAREKHWHFFLAGLPVSALTV